MTRPTRKSFPAAVPKGTFILAKWWTEALDNIAWYSDSDFPSGGQFPAINTSSPHGYRSRVIGPTDLLSLALQSPWKEVRKSHYAFAVSHLLPGGLVSEEVFSRLYMRREAMDSVDLAALWGNDGTIILSVSRESRDADDPRATTFLEARIWSSR